MSNPPTTPPNPIGPEGEPSSHQPAPSADEIPSADNEQVVVSETDDDLEIEGPFNLSPRKNFFMQQFPFREAFTAAGDAFAARAEMRPVDFEIKFAEVVSRCLDKLPSWPHALPERLAELTGSLQLVKPNRDLLYEGGFDVLRQILTQTIQKLDETCPEWRKYVRVQRDKTMYADDGRMMEDVSAGLPLFYLPWLEREAKFAPDSDFARKKRLLGIEEVFQRGAAAVRAAGASAPTRGRWRAKSVRIIP